MLNDRSTTQTSGLGSDTLTEKTVQHLLGWLRDGTFKPGSKLPSQNELVEQLGISRTGVREALQVMSALNLVEIRPGSGCFVKTVATEYIVHPDVLAILLEKESILEVIEVRKILEAGTAALAAERAVEADYWIIEDVLGLIAKAIDRGESVAGLTPEVHIAIAKATHNPVLAKLVTSFTGLMAKAGKLMEATALDLTAFKRYELSTHRDLYDVVRAGDPQKASRAMLEHIEASQALIVRGFLQAQQITDQG
jgi:GntR family transcriptional repressor for pyruvate dehydrogenase complex